MFLLERVKEERNGWLTISLVNLCIVALIGLLLRGKILFSIPGIDFENLLHAHSHFAFAGWITLCLLTLITYEILPASYSLHIKYKLALILLLVSAVGMLCSFPVQGYGVVSIFFSTIFIFVSYYYTWIFLCDIFRARVDRSVRLLCTIALASLVLSSVGPFTLAYIMATHSAKTFLYKDAIYTYLHLQYNGFFTLSVFALLFNYLTKLLSPDSLKQLNRFSIILCASVLPTLCLSYLWHFANPLIRAVAVIGCVFLILTVVQFFAVIRSAQTAMRQIDLFSRRIGLLSMVAFVLKSIIQIGLIFPIVGNKVFGDRAMIIAYLHLVMLGFITLYLLAYLIHIEFLKSVRIAVRFSITIFAVAIIVNEAILTFQGLSAMLMISSALYPVLLWLAAIGLFAGAMLIANNAISCLRLQRGKITMKVSGRIFTKQQVHERADKN